MPIIQVAYEVSGKTFAGLTAGTLTRFGSVVRDSKGITEHLKEISLPKKSGKGLDKSTVMAVGLGVVTIAAMAGGIALFLKRRKNKKRKKCIENYNASFCAYLEAVQNGNMDIDIINKLISDLDEVKKFNDKGKLYIEFSSEQLETLVDMVFDYTKILAETNSVELDNLEKPEFDSADNTIFDIRHYLEFQKQIIEKAA